MEFLLTVVFVVAEINDVVGRVILTEVVNIGVGLTVTISRIGDIVEDFESQETNVNGRNVECETIGVSIDSEGLVVGIKSFLTSFRIRLARLVANWMIWSVDVSTGLVIGDDEEDEDEETE